LTALRRELARRSPITVEQAAGMLLGAAGDSLNRRFATGAAGIDNYHVPIVDGTDLRRILCVQRVCRVGPSGIVSLGGRQLRLIKALRSPRGLPASVVVSQWLDGSLHILEDGVELPFLETGSAAVHQRLAI